MTTLFLVRHCSVDYSGDISTDLNISLSDRGCIQSVDLADKWNLSVDKIYSSTMPRAIETISPLANKINKSIIRLSELKELEYNGEAHTFHQKIKDNIEFKYVGGESITEANDRFLHCLIDICGQTNGSKIIVSTHGTVLSEFLIKQFDFSPDCFFDLSYPDVFEINYNKPKFTFCKRHIELLPKNSENLLNIK